MEHLLKPLLPITFFLYMTISYAADNLLQNGDFENETANTGTSQFLLLNITSSNIIIPGWSFSGTVYYVTSGNNLSFPANGGHAIQLAGNGSINQTFRGTDDVLEYVLSFNLAVLNEGCAVNYNHTAAVNVTVYVTTVFESSEVTHSERWSVFYYDRNISRRLWETNAFYLGQLGNINYVNLEIKSVTMNNSADHNVASNCWPLVDAFTVKRNHLPRWYDGNQLANGDFEVGPSFLKNSLDGILLNQEQDRFNSPLQQWSILGTIKYINSERYRVPHGKAAIELLSSGYSSGIQTDLILQPASTYTLSFTMGDANDSCVGLEDNLDKLLQFQRDANERWCALWPCT
ncbi:hypothetical protein PHJA_001785800 [Phtheirospermum japonicum]|uniref:DUF642 domain-containing protein n=1 Tax=Phtheirospermum japonicum TaxID=374723 RepID=A0A830C6T1_9LAMI|nr:hypothetical protein PHJA_001785800 [Phtheirospermum japonicum]